MNMDAILRMMEQVHQITRDNNPQNKINGLVSQFMSQGNQIAKERADFLNNLMQDRRQQANFEQQSKLQNERQDFQRDLQNERQDFQREQNAEDRQFKQSMKEEEIPSHIDSFISSTNKNHKEYIDGLNQVGIGYDSAVKTLQKYTDEEKKNALNAAAKIFQDTIRNAKDSELLKDIAAKLGLKDDDQLNPNVLNKMLDDKGNETIFRTAIANLEANGMNREAEFLNDLAVESSNEAGRVTKSLRQNSIRALMLKKGNIVNNVYTIDFENEKNLDEAILKPWKNELHNAESLLEKNYDQLRAFIDKNPEFSEYKSRFLINTIDDIMIKKIIRLPQEKKDLAKKILKNNPDVTDLYDIEDLLKENGIKLK